jgi:HlyD family secretion protein
VFRVEANRARLAPVDIGRRSTRSAEVLAGVSEGDHVVTYPSDRITAGTSVAARDTIAVEP